MCELYDLINLYIFIYIYIYNFHQKGQSVHNLTIRYDTKHEITQVFVYGKMYK